MKKYLLIVLLFLGVVGCSIMKGPNLDVGTPTDESEIGILDELPESMAPDTKSEVLKNIKEGKITEAVKSIKKATKKDVKKDKSVAQKSMDWILILLIPLCIIVSVAAIPIAIWVDKKWGIKAGITGVGSLAVLVTISVLFPAFVLIGKIIAGVLIVAAVVMLVYGIYKLSKNHKFLWKTNDALIEGQSATMNLTGQDALDELKKIQDKDVKDFVKAKLDKDDSI